MRTGALRSGIRSRPADGAVSAARDVDLARRRQCLLHRASQPLLPARRRRAARRHRIPRLSESAGGKHAGAMSWAPGVTASGVGQLPRTSPGAEFSVRVVKRDYTSSTVLALEVAALNNTALPAWSPGA